MEQTITSITLVRNGADKLRRAIRSVRGHVERVLVVDTGSEDDSALAAAQEGAIVLQLEWPGAFDEAFNWAFSQVDSGWILRLDFDEWFEEAEATKLRELAEDADVFGYNLLSRNLDGRGGYCETLALRMWRSHPELRYRGVCHEAFPRDDYVRAAAGRSTGSLGVWYWHDGYTGVAVRQKLRRDLVNVEKELEIRPGQVKYEVARAELLHMLGSPEGSRLLESLCKSACFDRSPSAPSSMLAVAFWTFLDSVPSSRLYDSDVSRIARQSALWFPRCPQMRYVLARFESRRKRGEAALEHLLALEGMARTGVFDRSLRYNSSVLAGALWTALEQTAAALGRGEIARRARSCTKEWARNGPPREIGGS